MRTYQWELLIRLKIDVCKVDGGFTCGDQGRNLVLKTSESAAPFDIVRFTDIDSTNRFIKEEIRHGAPEWRIAFARQQTQGYGRHGKPWSSPLGGLYFSVLLNPAKHNKPVFEFPTLSLCASLALRRSLLAYGLTANLGIKWPNDVVVADPAAVVHRPASLRKGVEFDKFPNPKESLVAGNCARIAPWAKLAGVSLEAVDTSVCLGVGVNVFRSEPRGEKQVEYSSPVEHTQESLQESRAFSSNSKYWPAYLAEMGDIGLFQGAQPETHVPPEGMSEAQIGFIEQLLFILLEDLQKAYNEWIIKGFSPFKDEYQASSFLQGKHVQLRAQSDGKLCEGVVCGVDEYGRLCLIDDLGALIHASSGEVHIM